MVSGQQIKAKRKELKLSVLKLGARLGIDPENIYKWEKGTKPSDPDDYKKIEKFVLGDLENMENIPNMVSEPQAPYGNLSNCISIIESQQKLLTEQHKMLQGQQETIHFLVTVKDPGMNRKKAS